MSTEDFVYIGEPVQIDEMASNSRSIKPLFKFGNVRATLPLTCAVNPNEAVDRMVQHAIGILGYVDAAEEASNNHALENGGLIKSRYKTSNGVQFLIVTEADRSMTTIMLEHEYQKIKSTCKLKNN